MKADELATRVIQAVQGNPDAIKGISEALASGDPAAIQGSLSAHAGIEISEVEAQEIAATVKADPSQPAAYCT